MDRAQAIQLVREWVEIDEGMALAKQRIKEFKAQRKALEGQLIGLMKENQIDEFDLSHGKLIRTTHKSKSSLTKKHVVDSLAKYFKNEEKAKEASGFIYGLRTEKVCDKIY